MAETTIQSLIDAAIQEEQDKRSQRIRSGKISPSMMGRCYRAQYWNRKNEPPTNQPDTRTLRVFRTGNLFHDFVQQFFSQADTEVKIETDDILGYADLVLPDEVVDIKSQHSKAFWYMKREGADINKDKFTNILQVMTYCKFLNKPKGRLVFVSKDDLCIAEYIFYLSDWEEEVEKELSTLRDIWDKQELPPAEPRAYMKQDGKSSECGYCNWQILCKQIEKGDQL